MRELTDFILKDELIPIQKKRPESIVGMALKVDCICNLNHEVEGFLILLQKQKTKIELNTRIKQLTGTRRTQSISVLLDAKKNNKIFNHYKSIFEQNR